MEGDLGMAAPDGSPKNGEIGQGAVSIDPVNHHVYFQFFVIPVPASSTLVCSPVFILSTAAAGWPWLGIAQALACLLETSSGWCSSAHFPFNPYCKVFGNNPINPFHLEFSMVFVECGAIVG